MNQQAQCSLLTLDITLFPISYVVPRRCTT